MYENLEFENFVTRIITTSQTGSAFHRICAKVHQW